MGKKVVAAIDALRDVLADWLLFLSLCVGSRARTEAVATLHTQYMDVLVELYGDPR